MITFFSAVLYASLFAWSFFQYPADSASIDSFQIVQFFDQYAMYAGIGFALLSFVGILILKGLLSLFRVRSSMKLDALLIFVGYLPWGLFAYQLLYREPRYANIAKAIIEYLAFPMGIAALGCLVLSLLMFTKSFFRPSSS